jgi:dolichol-phosphate mannosyltransferase
MASRNSTLMSDDPGVSAPLRLLSILIPARNESGCIASTIEHLHLELRLHNVPHEIVVVDDGFQNGPLHGFGRAVVKGLDHMSGDAVVIMMADESDDCRDVVRYWRELGRGYECVFGSRFARRGGVIDYPIVKRILNRTANLFIRVLFGISLNDTTNAFKAYKREVIEGCRPLISPHFNLTIELPLKAIVRGYTWTMIPITWRNRRTGIAKLKIREMGSRYFFICIYVWLEKYFSRGDYRRAEHVLKDAR